MNPRILAIAPSSDGHGRIVKAFFTTPFRDVNVNSSKRMPTKLSAITARRQAKIWAINQYTLTRAIPVNNY